MAATVRPSEKLGDPAEELAAAPAGADLGLGCGNPLAIASIQPGETVLDLGSGRVIGVDMTAAMISKARGNAAQSGCRNVEFHLGEIEALRWRARRSISSCRTV